MIVQRFGGCLPSEGLAGPGVEGRGDGVEVILAVSAEVGAFRVPLCLSSGWLCRRRVVVGESGK
jgi:hypothetical protein